MTAVTLSAVPLCSASLTSNFAQSLKSTVSPSASPVCVLLPLLLSALPSLLSSDSSKGEMEVPGGSEKLCRSSSSSMRRSCLCLALCRRRVSSFCRCGDRKAATSRFSITSKSPSEAITMHKSRDGSRGLRVISVTRIEQQLEQGSQ